MMFVIDRAILAYYSIDSMNAAAIAGNMVSILAYVFMSVAYISGVYVGQYNGAGEYKKLAEPVWQMIFLSFLSILFFVPAGYFSKYLNFFPQYYEAEGIEYQSVLMPFCFLPCLTAALTAFFVGRGKTVLVTFVVVIGNVLNALLDIVFVFGIKNIIPSFGCKGAAVATIISEAIQVIILAIVFLNKHNREKYNTAHCVFDKKLFISCFKTGIPLSVGRFMELLAWYVIYIVISHVSKDLATIHGISICVYVLFFFITEGMMKSVAALSSNLIGMKNLDGIRRLFRIFMWMTCAVSFFLVVFLVIYPDIIFSFLSNTNNDISGLYGPLRSILRVYAVIITVDTVACVLYGILQSGGDTRYPVIVNITTLWTVVIAPVLILFFTKNLTNVITVQFFCLGWTLITLFFLYRRYKSLKWYKHLI